MKERSIALVTGASGGIGLELARLLAADGHDLVLVSRGGERLEAAASDLSARYGVRTLPRPIDLSVPGSAAALVRDLPDDWKRIDVLVNNAAFGIYGPFAETPVEETLGMMRLNMEALAHLSALLLPSMREAGRGRILNVASVAAFTPGPLMNVYYATKAFVLSFSEALARELAGSGVTVTAFCPGPVRTGFQARAGIGPSRLLRFFPPMEAEKAARIGYRAMRKGRTVAVAGVGNRLVVLLIRLLPRTLAVEIAYRIQARRKK